MIKRVQYQEGIQARIAAEVDLVINHVPVQFSCVYKRFEKRESFTCGWQNVKQIDIDIAVQHAKGEIPTAHHKFTRLRARLNEKLKGSLCYS